MAADRTDLVFCQHFHLPVFVVVHQAGAFKAANIQNPKKPSSNPKKARSFGHLRILYGALDLALGELRQAKGTTAAKRDDHQPAGA